jgi:hypothetical protein
MASLGSLAGAVGGHPALLALVLLNERLDICDVFGRVHVLV